MEIKHSDSDGLASNNEPALVVMSISRDEVEKKRIASTLEKLMTMSDSKEKVMLYKDSLALLFEGYDEDARELVEIPEVRAFMKELLTEWPYWMWYLARFSGDIQRLMGCLCEISTVRRGGRFGFMFRDYDEVQKVIREMHNRSRFLYSLYEIDEQLVQESIYSFVEVLG